MNRITKMNNERIIIESVLHSKAVIDWDDKDILHVFAKPRQHSSSEILTHALNYCINNGNTDDSFQIEAKRFLKQLNNLKSGAELKLWNLEVNTFLKNNNIPLP